MAARSCFRKPGIDSRITLSGMAPSLEQVSDQSFIQSTIRVP